MPSFDEIQNIFGYHTGTAETIPQHESTRAIFLDFAVRLNAILPEGRAKELAFTNLQQASMWSNFAIAETTPVVFPVVADKPNTSLLPPMGDGDS